MVRLPTFKLPKSIIITLTMKKKKTIILWDPQLR
ncbi:unnamed protein product, partial [marine sediment metagenome]